MGESNRSGIITHEATTLTKTRHLHKRVRGALSAETSARKRVNIGQSHAIPAAPVKHSSDLRFASFDHIDNSVPIGCGTFCELNRCRSLKEQLRTQPTANTDNLIANEELAEACVALKLKLERDKNGHRQYGRRLKSEPFRLSSSQKILMATSYRTARSENRSVDYERMATSIHFKTFRDNPQALQVMEIPLIHELKEALDEQRKIEATERAITPNEWKEELARCEVLWRQETERLQNTIRLLEERRSAEIKTIACLRSQVASLSDENNSLKRANVSVIAQSDISNTLKVHGKDLHALKERVDKHFEIQERICVEIKELASIVHAKRSVLHDNDPQQSQDYHLSQPCVKLQRHVALTTMADQVQQSLDQMRQKYYMEQWLWRKENRSVLHKLSKAIDVFQTTNSCHQKADSIDQDHPKPPTRATKYRQEAIHEALRMVQF